VLGANNTPANQAVLLGELGTFSAYFKQFVIDSTPASPWGPARLDAFGMIFNRVANIDLDRPGNNRKPNAPVSYPFLWGTSWHDYTQWNGQVRNDGDPPLGHVRRLARNVGQVLGVFGTIDLGTTPTYPSSARRVELVLLEEAIAKLTAPAWPDAIFGAPDAARVARGGALYGTRCEGCHKLVPRDQQLRPAQVTRVLATGVGTDDAMTKMVATRTADTAMLQGRLMDVFLGRSIGPNERTTDILSHAVIGAMADSNFWPPMTPPPTEALFDPSIVAETYKARPLNGIWATGPYLHNGSVRTLFQVLLPEARRETSFHVGSREFDPVEVGFKNAPGVIGFVLDTTVPGNRNTGHRYGDALSDEERKDLVEYLKTL
jgi:mono/diheme cytochrome c family protein